MQINKSRLIELLQNATKIAQSSDIYFGFWNDDNNFVTSHSIFMMCLRSQAGKFMAANALEEQLESNVITKYDCKKLLDFISACDDVIHISYDNRFISINGGNINRDFRLCEEGTNGIDEFSATPNAIGLPKIIFSPQYIKAMAKTKLEFNQLGDIITIDNSKMYCIDRIQSSIIRSQDLSDINNPSILTRDVLSNVSSIINHSPSFNFIVFDNLNFIRLTHFDADTRWYINIECMKRNIDQAVPEWNSVSLIEEQSIEMASFIINREECINLTGFILKDPSLILANFIVIPGEEGSDDNVKRIRININGEEGSTNIILNCTTETEEDFSILLPIKQFAEQIKCCATNTIKLKILKHEENNIVLWKVEEQHGEQSDSSNTREGFFVGANNDNTEVQSRNDSSEGDQD